MKRAGPRPHQRLPRARLVFSRTTFLLSVVCCVTACASVWTAVARAHTVARGVAEPTIVTMDANAQQASIDTIGNTLGATYIRFFVSWAAAQPDNPATTPFDPNSSYMTHVASAVSIANNAGLKVIVTFFYVPKWASNQKFWGTKGYRPNVAMSGAALNGFQRFCQAVATQLEGKVYAYECWNEPNLASFLYPQTWGSNRNYAPDFYVQMLDRCRKGILDGDPSDPLIVAGATAPRGSNDGFSTAPQRFAARIKADGAAPLFDAYSHHPYMPGASPRLWPEAAPAHPDTTVTLQNLGTLLKIFPRKQFFLTEYGVQTAPSLIFSNQCVNQATQASYLRRAYSFVARYGQVKLLMWYLLKDQRPPDLPSMGFYTGLETYTGAAKRSFYVFARGNQLTLAAPTTIKRGSTISLTGTLSCASVGPLPGKPLILQMHRPGYPWATVKTVTTDIAGAFVASYRPSSSAYYRVQWEGVVMSPSRYITVK